MVQNSRLSICYRTLPLCLGVEASAASCARLPNIAGRKSSITPHSSRRARACPLECVYNSLQLEWKLGACNWGQNLIPRRLSEKWLMGLNSSSSSWTNGLQQGPNWPLEIWVPISSSRGYIAQHFRSPLCLPSIYFLANWVIQVAVYKNSVYS